MFRSINSLRSINPEYNGPRLPYGLSTLEEFMMIKDTRSGEYHRLFESDDPSDPTEDRREVLQVFEDLGYKIVKVIAHEFPDGIEVAHTLDGKYIGDPKMAEFLCKKHGIKPELASPDHNICTIGFSEKDNKWYGWSHRAIYGFTVGDKVQEGDLTATSGWTAEWLKEHPEEDKSLPLGFEAKTMDDAKRMAIAFADAVG